jgi:hypothetical protein
MSASLLALIQGACGCEVDASEGAPSILIGYGFTVLCLSRGSKWEGVLLAILGVLETKRHSIKYTGRPVKDNRAVCMKCVGRRARCRPIVTICLAS